MLSIHVSNSCSHEFDLNNGNLDHSQFKFGKTSLADFEVYVAFLRQSILPNQRTFSITPRNYGNP